MKWACVGLAALSGWALPAGAASAGPIGWSYSSTGGGTGRYSFTGQAAAFESTPGRAQEISVIGDVHAPLLVSPIPLEGPTFATRVTLTDAASGRSGSFDVPVLFFDNETAPEGELDSHIAGLGAFPPRRLVLGRNRYVVDSDSTYLFVVAEPAAAATPEPSSVLLAGVGLAAVGWRRLSRRGRGARPLNRPQ